jgi:hypothetical protein
MHFLFPSLADSKPGVKLENDYSYPVFAPTVEGCVAESNKMLIGPNGLPGSIYQTVCAVLLAEPQTAARGRDYSCVLRAMTRYPYSVLAKPLIGS